MIRLAVPKGRLWRDSVRLLMHLGVEDRPLGRRYVFPAAGGDIEVVALKIQDIPTVLELGQVDLAIGSDEWLAQSSAEYDPLLALCWYHTKVCLIGHAEDAERLGDPDAKFAVATSFPGLADKLLDERFTAFEVAGSVEAFPGRFADFALDCVETGATVRANGLAVLAELMPCDVRLVAAPGVDLGAVTVAAIVNAAGECADTPDCAFGGQR